jgi:hypothetical protein
VIRHLAWWAACAVALGGASVAAAQTARDSARIASLPALPAIGNDADDRQRLAQLAGLATTDGYLLRSPSSMLAAADSAPARRRWTLLAATHDLTYNSALPFSMNDGALWAGRGLSFAVTPAAMASRGRVRIVLAPAVLFMGNQDFAFFTEPILTDFLPPQPPDRSKYASRFNVRPYSIDNPWRFGSEDYVRLDPGQSSLWVAASKLDAGVSSENQWWGPGVQNALVMSNNAPGFPHLFVRTGAPIRTRVGSFEGRWLVGLLSSSGFFAIRPPPAGVAQPLAESATDYRSISAIGVTWRLAAEPDLTLGFTRAVYAPISGWAKFPLRALDVFANTGRPNDRPSSDSALKPGRDQLFSLFGRWLFPRDGFEAYAEWARTEMPASVRDWLVAPNHTRGYTLGLQWRQPTPPDRGGVRVQAEITNVERSSTYKERPVGSFYTSRRVPQGYTQRGQVIGAAIGPGASSQWLAVDYVTPGWRAGVFAGRIRWNDDAYFFYPRPVWGGWCEHDVTVYPGVRGAASGRFGTGTASLSFGNRLNIFNENTRGCPRNFAMRDVRNMSLSVSFTPRSQPNAPRTQP